MISRDLQGSILCPKHKIIAGNICIEENCKNQINCTKCSIFDKHNHNENNFSITTMLDGNIDNQIFDDNLGNKEKIDSIKKDFENYKKEIINEIDLLEKVVIKVFEEEYSGSDINEKKKKFQEEREKYHSDNLNFSKLKSMAEKFNDFIRYSFEKTKSDDIDFMKNIKSFFQNTLTDFKNIKKDFKFPKMNIFLDSNLILKNEERYFIKDKLFDNKSFNTILLYKGSRDGFEASKFHSLCDNKGPTITFIKSHLNKIFGGFINDSWHSKDNYTYCKESFLFSLDKREKYKHKKSDKKYSYFGGKSYSVVFGGGFNGHDICISNNSNMNKDRYSNFGNTYTSPEGVIYNTPVGNSYLAGEHKFTVKEIEVYSIELL